MKVKDVIKHSIYDKVIICKRGDVLAELNSRYWDDAPENHVK